MKQSIFITETIINEKGEMVIVVRHPSGQALACADNVQDFISWLDDFFLKITKKDEKEDNSATDK